MHPISISPAFPVTARTWRLAAVMIGILALAPAGARADTAGGQGSMYNAYRQNEKTCTVYTPLVMKNVDGVSTTIVLRNESAIGKTVNWRLRKLGGGALTTRTANLPGSGSLTINAADLPVEDGFSGSFSAEATDCTGADQDLSAVFLHDSATGDRLAVEAAPNWPDLWHPAVHNDDLGVNTNVVIQNVDRDSSVVVRVIFLLETGGGYDRNITIAADSAASVDFTGINKGFMSIQIDGPADTTRLASAAYHMGPMGIAAANNALSFLETASRAFLPLIFKNGGFDGGYNSSVVVQKVGAGLVTPKITFRDRDTGDIIGPITAEQSIREGNSMRWDISKLDQLKDNKVYSAVVENDQGTGIGGQMAVLSGYMNMNRGLIGVYAGAALGDKDLTAPHVAKNANGLSSGIQVQSLTGRDQTVTIRFLNKSGTRVATATVTAPSRNSATVYLPAVAGLPDGFEGIAVLTAPDNIAAVVNTVRYKV